MLVPINWQFDPDSRSLYWSALIFPLLFWTRKALIWLGRGKVGGGGGGKTRRRNPTAVPGPNKAHINIISKLSKVIRMC